MAAEGSAIGVANGSRPTLVGLAAKGFFCALACMVVLMAVGAGGASAAARPRAHFGSLPGFPRIRGVIPVLGSSAAMEAHARLVSGAFAAERAARAKRATGAPVPSPEIPGEACPESFLFTQDVCYQDGPVLRDPDVHLIFWQGPTVKGEPSTPDVQAFPEGYEKTVEQYFEDVSKDSGKSTNVFSVDPEYGDSSGPGEYASLFIKESELPEDKPLDVAHAYEAFPVRAEAECEDHTEFSKGPCLLDQDISNEVKTVAEADDWQFESLKEVFFVFTPPGVGGCTEAGACAYRAYCGYHSDFGGDGEYNSPGDETVYANLAFPAPESGCDSGVHPNSTTDNGADAVIDNASAEFNEAITDPLGSQCNEKETVCEPFSWTDAIGQEIAAKCLPPEETVAGIYGELLEGDNVENAYNQLINGDHYFTQRVWSNDAGVGQGACVQRIVSAAFISENGEASVPVHFDGSGSGSAEDPVSYWEWNFGDGTILASPEPTISHTYAKSGEYSVTLTAFDIYGNANTVTHKVDIGPHLAPIPPAPAAPTTTTVTTTTTTNSPEVAPQHLSVAQLAVQLGLPAAGAKLSGTGTIRLGSAQCPPACGVQVQVFTQVRTTRHGHRATKQVLVGSAKLTLDAKGNEAIAFELNAQGRSLLHDDHKLNVTLKLAVEDPQGASWQISRPLTLMSSSTAARSRR